jgi:predicted RNase H-like HicB family nuclease
MIEQHSDNGHHHHLNLEITKGVSQVYIGQVVQIPSIMVQAETKEKLMEEAKEAVMGYFKAFPEAHDEVFGEEEPRLQYEKFVVAV